VLIGQVCFRENYLSMLIAAYFVSELTEESVVTLELGNRLNTCFWLDDARVNCNHICCSEMLKHIRSF